MPEPADKKIALVYTNDAYVEMLERRTNAPEGTAEGLIGRQVAGNEFLDAYFHFGKWKELVALVFDQAGADSVRERFKSHPTTPDSGRQLQIIARRNFHARFFPTSLATTLHFPCPFDAKYAWTRAAWGPGAFSLSGLTHTISTANTVRAMCDWVTAPVEPFDTLVCISRAAERVVRTITDNYAAYLNDRHGGKAKLRVRLVQIPLGVNPSKFRPASAEERQKERAALEIADDAVAVLFVGRLNFTGKVHPFAMFEALSLASRKTGRPVHMVLGGWARHELVIQRFQEAAAAFAPNLRYTIVDASKPKHRWAVWHCADVFTSLTDNIQETLSQTILEGMASGLPVVATDWDGCRDQVIDGETGFLVPTYMVRGSNPNLSSRLLIDELQYDYFLGECNQTVAVDVPAAAAAFARLIAEPDLRRKMGEAGRRRAIEKFAWPHVIEAYENLWAEQEMERKAFVASQTGSPKTFIMPAIFPPVEESFASYPKTILETEDRVIAPPDANDRLDLVLNTPISSYLADNRSTDREILAKIIAQAAAGCSIGDLDPIFQSASIARSVGRATLAWMLKYRLLVPELNA